ncbi:carboxymuconolactone decarboxylase family protein [Arthrobacter koreensis]|uniref:carboxymuconolactone decarboxylase family protein n=1 Tax=Arthrobacter koreensis TaxID=199136 RepID=UPI002DBEE091|nr:carboxymuconolactone decarboxylase family protein [Arthrobacter koreensis]MEB7505499.1 carboxymuconolactone decarboxylase family protein [Arthrobacter koreensis]
MPRINYAQTTPEVEAETKARRGGHLTPLDKLLAHSDSYARGWNILLGAVRQDFGLRDDLRELIILRVGHLNSARYEWEAHVGIGRKAGLTEAVLSVIASDSTSTGIPVYDAVLRYTDEMTRSVVVKDATFNALRTHFDERGLAEITATAATYNMVSRFLVALDVQPEDRRALVAGAGGR